MYSVILMAALTAGGATPDCHGCCGCYGGGCCGCYGGCYGCYGGCMGCYGGCMGCMGCYGGGCYGCWGGYGGWGGGYGMSYPGTVLPSTGAYPGTGAPAGEQLGLPAEDKTKKSTMLPTKAKLVVDLPPNSKLFIDDMPIKSAPGLRSFNTPNLEPGQAYYYMVRVETVRDGKTVSETRRVIVRAGQIARADFKDLDSDAVRTVQAK
ncbi:MAG: TIGR03000 domain-containing protein [Gemmataceae bacterium]